MNTMLRNKRTNLLSQIKKFEQNIKSTGKTPYQLLDELVKSGRFTSEQIEQAKRMAELFASKS